MVAAIIRDIIDALTMIPLSVEVDGRYLRTKVIFFDVNP